MRHSFIVRRPSATPDSALSKAADSMCKTMPSQPSRLRPPSTRNPFSPMSPELLPWPTPGQPTSTSNQWFFNISDQPGGVRSQLFGHWTDHRQSVGHPDRRCVFHHQHRRLSIGIQFRIRHIHKPPRHRPHSDGTDLEPVRSGGSQSRLDSGSRQRFAPVWRCPDEFRERRQSQRRGLADSARRFLFQQCDYPGFDQFVAGQRYRQQSVELAAHWQKGLDLQS